MKVVLIFALFASVKSEFDPKSFDWASVKPITETEEYRAAFPWRFNDEKLNKDARIFDRNGRIIRGEQASPTDFPFSVGLVISFTQNNGWCSGSLISRSFVLSAAQCLVGSETQITALLGASDITRVSEFLLVAEYRKHESFSERNLDNDIALLRLQREVVLSASVQVIRLPNMRQRGVTFEKQKVRVAGWGALTGASDEAIPVQRLHSIVSTVITNGSCRIRYLRIRDFNICTDSDGGQPCDGDEGSALTTIDFDNIKTLIGVYSYVSENRRRGCERGWPPVYTRTTSYLEWIQSHSDVFIREGF